MRGIESLSDVEAKPSTGLALETEDDMKKTLLISTGLALLVGTALATQWPAQARGPGGGPGGGPGYGPGTMMFEMMDTNEDGQITNEEFDARHDSRFDEFDADGDGKVTLDEAKQWRPAPNPRRAEMMFQRLDTDGDAIVTREEFDARSAGRFEAMDKNGDGAITADEVRAMQAPRGGKGGGQGPGKGSGPCGPGNAQ